MKMDIRKSLLLTITFCLSHNNKRKPQISKRDRSERVLVLKVLVKNHGVYSDLTKQDPLSRSNEQKISVWNCDCEKNEIVKHCWERDHNFSWDQKKVDDGECRLIPRKIKETIESKLFIFFNANTIFLTENQLFKAF